MAPFAGGGGFLIPVWFVAPVPDRAIYLVVAALICLVCFPALILVSKCPVCGKFSPFLSLILRNKAIPCRSCDTQMLLK